MSFSLSGIILTDYIINNPVQTLSSYIYNYKTPTINFFIDHNFFVSTGIYGNFYNYDYKDLSNNVIIPADSYIQRNLSISGNIYCSSLYNYIANQYVSNNTLTQSINNLNNTLTQSINTLNNNLNTNIANQLTQVIYSISGIITVDLLEYTKNITFNDYKQSNDLNIISLSGLVYNYKQSNDSNIISLNNRLNNLNIPVIPSDLVNKLQFDLYTNSLSGSILTLNTKTNLLANALNSLNIPTIPTNLVNKTTFDSYVNSLSGSILSVNNNLTNNYSTTGSVNTLISNALSTLSLASLNPLYLGGTNGLKLQYDLTNAYIRNLNTGYLYLGVQDTNSIKITNKGMIIGSSSDGVSNSITDSLYQSNSLCIVGQGVSPNRSITMWDNLDVRGSIKGSTINSTFVNSNVVSTLENEGNGFYISGTTNTNRWLLNNYPNETKLGFRGSNTNINGTITWTDTVFSIDRDGNTITKSNLSVGNTLNVSNGIKVSGGNLYLNSNQIKTSSSLNNIQFFGDLAFNYAAIKVFKCDTYPNYQKQITINMPVCFRMHLNAFNVHSMRFKYKINNIECKVYRNGILWLTQNAIGDYLEYRGAVNQEDIYATLYLTMASLSFTPARSDTYDTYEVRCTPSLLFEIIDILQPSEQLTDYWVGLVFNETISDYYWSEIPNNNTNYPKYLILYYDNPNTYKPYYFTETIYNNTNGAVFINDLFVNKLYFHELFTYTSGVAPSSNASTNNTSGVAPSSNASTNNTNNTNTIDPNNPTFLNIFLQNLTNANPLIDFGFNDTTREQDAGKIKYGGSLAQLEIYGCGSSVYTRNIKLYDNVIINNNLTVNNSVNTLNVFTSNLVANSNIVTSLFNCDVLTAKISATMGNINVNDNASSIYPLNVGKNSNNNSINCSGNIISNNIATNDLICKNIYYSKSINNIDVIDKLLTISNQVYSLTNSFNSLSGLINTIKYKTQKLSYDESTDTLSVLAILNTGTFNTSSIGSYFANINSITSNNITTGTITSSMINNSNTINTDTMIFNTISGNFLNCYNISTDSINSSSIIFNTISGNFLNCFSAYADYFYVGNLFNAPLIQTYFLNCLGPASVLQQLQITDNTTHDYVVLKSNGLKFYKSVFYPNGFLLTYSIDSYGNVTSNSLNTKSIISPSASVSTLTTDTINNTGNINCNNAYVNTISGNYLNCYIINGNLSSNYAVKNSSGITNIDIIKSNNIVLDNNTDGILWANHGSQIYDDGNLQIVTDDLMIFRIGTTWTNAIQLADTFIYNNLNVSDNIKLINTNGLTFFNSVNTTLMILGNSGNLNVTGSITSGYTIPLNNNSSTVATTQWVQTEGFCHLGKAETITGVKTFNTNPIVTNQYLNGVATLQSAATFTITAPYQEYYPLAPTANQTITFPVASASLLGVRIRLRRVGGTITTTINSASSNIYPNTSFTASNVLLAANSLNVVVTCLYLTATTYGWFIA